MSYLIFVLDKHNYMEGNSNVTKGFRRQVNTSVDAAITFYQFVSAFYNIHLSPMEVGVLAFTALYGTISTPPAREAFVKYFSSSKASLNNLISKLQQRELLVKDEKLKIRVRPEINMDFSGSSYMVKLNVNIKEVIIED